MFLFLTLLNTNFQSSNFILDHDDVLSCLAPRKRKECDFRTRQVLETKRHGKICEFPDFILYPVFPSLCFPFFLCRIFHVLTSLIFFLLSFHSVLSLHFLGSFFFPSVHLVFSSICFSLTYLHVLSVLPSSCSIYALPTVLQFFCLYFSSIFQCATSFFRYFTGKICRNPESLLWVYGRYLYRDQATHGRWKIQTGGRE